ncbi:MAG: methyl-accepting chemotaxis protein, partial [Burkholderiaceae bacterium]
AGEAGRGFAVVASEVRMLARRSAEAAKEIASLIHASTERVESGTRQVQAAGSTMDDIVGSVERVSHIIREISATTGAQSGEIGMVSESVTELDQMTQQNAALVEESAAAAESMKQQALRLSELVNAFKLPLGQGR